MCGIVYKRREGGKEHLGKSITRMYQAQRNRGTEGFGFVAVEKSDKKFYVREYLRYQNEKDVLQSLKRLRSMYSVLFHHRLPTSTINVAEAAHPIKVSNDKLKYDYYVVHNGVIHSPKDKHDAHVADGFAYNTTIIERTSKKAICTNGQEYIIHSGDDKIYEDTVTFNDSETLAIELAKQIDVWNGEIHVDVSGTMAFIVIQVDKNTNEVLNIFFGRNDGNPLHELEDKDRKTISLTSQAQPEVKQAGITSSAVVPYYVNKTSPDGTFIEAKRFNTKYSYYPAYYGGHSHGTPRYYDDELEEYYGVKNLPAPQSSVYCWEHTCTEKTDKKTLCSDGEWRHLCDKHATKEMIASFGKPKLQEQQQLPLSKPSEIKIYEPQPYKFTDEYTSQCRRRYNDKSFRFYKQFQDLIWLVAGEWVNVPNPDNDNVMWAQNKVFELTDLVDNIALGYHSEHVSRGELDALSMLRADAEEELEHYSDYVEKSKSTNEIALSSGADLNEFF